MQENLERNDGLVGGPGETVASSSSEQVLAPGPILVPATVQDTKNVSRSTEQRTKTKPDPRDETKPPKYHKDSEVAIRHRKFFDYLRKKVFTTAAIRNKNAELFGEQSLGDIGRGVFSQEQIAGATSRNELYTGGESFPMRKAGEKLEVVNKQGKTSRSVVDNGIELFTAFTGVFKICEGLKFKKGARLYNCSIKGRKRNQVLKEFTSRLDGENIWMLEKDQTNMECHERIPRTLRQVY